MKTFGVATKAVIFNEKIAKYLILKKSSLEEITPNTFDVPGGRVEFGEDLVDSVIREAKEETQLDVEVVQVFNAWTFVNDDQNFQLTGVDYFCTTEQESVDLSAEHSDYEWKEAKEIIEDDKYPGWLRKTIEKAERIRMFSAEANVSE